MRCFTLFSPDFTEWSLAIARTLREWAPSTEISGLVTGSAGLHTLVAEGSGPTVGPLHRLDELEREWLSRPLSAARQDTLKASLGGQSLHRLVVADRHLGRGFISGGLTAETALSRSTKDPELRERYLFGLLDYVDRLLRDHAPDVVFCHTVADAPAVALGLVSKSLGIPFAQIRHTRLGSRVIIDTSPFDDLEPVRESFERILLTGRYPPGIEDAARGYLASARQGSSAPDYVGYHRGRIRHQQSFRRLGQVAASHGARALMDWALRRRRDLREPPPLQTCALELQAAVLGRRLLAGGPFLACGERPTRPFAFFPLHVDPEASTMVQSPMHTDQLSLVESLAKSLPAGMSLLVKEHMPMLGRRPSGFYRRLAEMPGVTLASPLEQGLALVRDAALNAVISSTAGWESILLGKPTVVTAFPPYSMVGDGFVHCPDVTQLPEAVNTALDTPPADERRILAYIAAILDCSFDCPTESLWGSVTAETVAAQPEIARQIATRLLAIAGSPHAVDSPSRPVFGAPQAQAG